MDFAKQEFVLKSTFQNLAERKEVYSLVETHFNVPWRILVECFNEGLKVFLICKNTTRSNLWSIDVDFTIKLTSAAYSFNKCISGTFNRSNTTLGWDDFTQWKGMIERSPTKPGGLHTPVVAIEKLNVEIHAEIKRIIGVNRKRTVKFDEMDENVTDVCLIVEQKKFFVSKTFLASFSKFFHVMFFGEFVEKGAAEVVIQDVNADVFKVFLSLIYVTSDPGITDQNVEQLLVLADRYDVSLVTKECENFLKFTERTSIDNKLRIAEQFSLSDLQEKCLDSLGSMKQIKTVREKFNPIGIVTATALLDRAITLYN